MINLWPTDPLPPPHLHNYITNHYTWIYNYLLAICMYQTNLRILFLNYYHERITIWPWFIFQAKKTLTMLRMRICHVYCICIHIIHVCMYHIYFIYIVINIISYNSCNYNHNIQFLNFILTVFQTSWGWLVMLDDTYIHIYDTYIHI